MLERATDGSLVFYGLDVDGFGGLYNYHKLDYFDFNKIHTFEFLKHSDRWVPAIDGITLTGDVATSVTYDTFVKTMSEKSAGKTVVSFAPNSADDTVLTVKNIHFLEKAVDATDADWVKMNGVTVTGDADSGYDIQGKEYLTAYYRHPRKAADTTVHFALSIEDGMWNTLALAENMGMPLLPSLEEMKENWGTVFIFERKGENFCLQVWEGQYIFNLKTYENFDFNGTHALTFTNEHGNWYVVFDGEVIRSRQLNEVAGAMLASETGVRYRFSGCYDDYRFHKVQFADTPHVECVCLMTRNK